MQGKCIEIGKHEVDEEEDISETLVSNRFIWGSLYTQRDTGEVGGIFGAKIARHPNFWAYFGRICEAAYFHFVDGGFIWNLTPAPITEGRKRHTALPLNDKGSAIFLLSNVMMMIKVIKAEICLNYYPKFEMWIITLNTQSRGKSRGIEMCWR